MVVIIRKVKDDFGCFGNMSPHPIEYKGVVWPTAEALFQAFRFEGRPDIQESLQNEKNPMRAKMLAKKYAASMTSPQLGEQDLNNMRQVLALKLEQHPDVKNILIQTTDQVIVEDCTRRQGGSGLFWGAALKNGTWVGKNWLGKLWMELRAEIT